MLLIFKGYLLELLKNQSRKWEWLAVRTVQLKVRVLHLSYAL